MNASKKIEYQKLLMGLVPESGDNIGNVSLREQLREKITSLGDELTDEDYWLLRDSLIDGGLLEQGRGRGGSVHRIKNAESDSGAAPVTASVAVPVAESPVIGAQESPEVIDQRTEASLYEPFYNAIVNGYTKDNRLKRFISEITAHQGRRSTGGRWTRPDMTLVAVRTYQFTPGKRLEVITFEVKPDLDSAIEGIYEALAHSAFAHRSYLAIDIRDFTAPEQDIPDDRIVQECTRHGVGYIAFTNVADYDTYEIVCTAKLKEPDPEEVDNFIKKQISPQKQDELRELF